MVQGSGPLFPRSQPQPRHCGTGRGLARPSPHPWRLLGCNGAYHSPRLSRCGRWAPRWDYEALRYQSEERGLKFSFFLLALLPFPLAPGGRRMCQLKAESKEACADYLPLQGSIFGCSAPANSMNRAVIQERSHMRVIVSRIHFTPLRGPEALLLFRSLFFFRWQRVSQRKR